MDREEFNRCISSAMKGRQLSKEERKLEFCVNAKLCSGKTKDKEEARRLCSLPKEPKLPKAKRRRERKDDCGDVDVFFEAASQPKKLYLEVTDRDCTPCKELGRKIKDADIPVPIVQIPAHCTEIIDRLGVDAFPTVVLLSKGKVVSKYTGGGDDVIERMKRGE